MSEGFPPARRIRKGRVFAAVLRRGRRRRFPHFTLHVLPASSGGCARLGVIASRRVGGAVARNRAKRLLREAFRRCAARLPPGADLVAVARGSIAKARLEDIERALRDAFREKAAT